MLPNCFVPNEDCVRVLRAVDDGKLVEEWEVQPYIVARFVSETGDICNPYELTEDGQEALRRV